MLRIVVVRAMGQAPAQESAAEFGAAGGAIGRASSCTLHLPDPYQHISREQVRVLFQDGQYSVVACGIPNIVSLNGNELVKDVAAPVQHGDRLVVGEFELIVEFQAAAPAPVAAAELPAESPTQFWNSLGSGTKTSAAADPFANLFAPPSGAPGKPAAPPGVSAPVPSSGVIPDDFDIWGDLSGAPASAPKAMDLPLGGPGDAKPRLAPDQNLLGSPGRSQDALGLGGLTGSGSGDGNIDDLFGLKSTGGVASSDPLGVAGSRQKNHTSEPIQGNIGALLNAPRAYTDAPLADHTPEIQGTFQLPQARSSPEQDLTPPAPPFALPPAPPLAPPMTAPQILPPDAVKEIAEQVASEHQYIFEDTPKTQATDLLEGLNRQSMKAQLKQKLEQAARQAVPTAMPPAAPAPAPVATPFAPGPLSPALAAAPAAMEPPAPTPQPRTAAVNVSGASDSQASKDELLAAFLAGLNLPKLPKTALSVGQPDAGLTPLLMERLGALLRISTQGTQDLLTARNLLKREMKTEVTMIVSKDNNPLKFSPDTESALAHLLSPIPIRGFLTPAESVQDAFNDLNAHQMAFVAGMRAAIQSLVDKFDPAHLEARLTKKSMIESMVPATRKAKLWERFSELYAEISREAEDDFEAFFGKEFVKAYEAQVKSLDRKTRPD